MKKTEIIETTTGKVQGILEEDLAVFKGIPYAEPPVGDLRFLEPVAKKPWEGVLDASDYGACAYQGYTELEEWLGKPEPESEDCLFLNIWTPKIDENNPEEKKRPVLFWIHGGAFIIGCGKDPMYKGSSLASRGDVVVVTINYRLGSFGFLNIPNQIINVGSLDQITALKWVHDNIERFGGDPDNITIFGESAGAYSVLSLCAMPAAKGLFNRVIAQSAPTIDPRVDKKSTRKIFRKLGIKKPDLKDLKDIPAEKIIEAQNAVFESDPTNILALRPYIDGEIWTKRPRDAFGDEDCKDLSLMIGTNKEEFKLFSNMEVLKKLLEGDPLKMLVGFLGMAGIPADKINSMIDTYKKAREGKESTEPIELFNAIVTDYAFRYATTRLLEEFGKHSKDCYNYLFEWKSPAFDGDFGACHALEIPFVFGTLNEPTLREFVQGAPKDLSEKMMDAWIAFARTGNPNHENLPEWKPYTEEKRATMVFAEECALDHALMDAERKAWEGIL